MTRWFSGNSPIDWNSSEVRRNLIDVWFFLSNSHADTTIILLKEILSCMLINVHKIQASLGIKKNY